MIWGDLEGIEHTYVSLVFNQFKLRIIVFLLPENKPSRSISCVSIRGLHPQRAAFEGVTAARQGLSFFKGSFKYSLLFLYREGNNHLICFSKRQLWWTGGSVGFRATLIANNYWNKQGTPILSRLLGNRSGAAWHRGKFRWGGGGWWRTVHRKFPQRPDSLV